MAYHLYQYMASMFSRQERGHASMKDVDFIMARAFLTYMPQGCTMLTRSSNKNKLVFKYQAQTVTAVGSLEHGIEMVVSGNGSDEVKKRAGGIILEALSVPV